MDELIWIIAALFLPLFPLGMVFNGLFQQVKFIWIRVVILLAWPLLGIWILQTTSPVIPDWVAYWALFSALLYGFRAVVVKEFGMWVGFLATSSWAMTWIALEFGVVLDELILHALAFSLPLSLLAILVAELEKRYESAYAGIINGLAEAQPRLCGLLVIAVLAAIGSPLFPAFFSMLDTISHTVVVLPVISLGLVTTWLLWSWSGITLLQTLMVGSASQIAHADLGQGSTVIYGSSLVAMMIGGLFLAGLLL